jgi:hypothetical protein
MGVQVGFRLGGSDRRESGADWGDQRREGGTGGNAVERTRGGVGGRVVSRGKKRRTNFDLKLILFSSRDTINFHYEVQTK